MWRYLGLSTIIAALLSLYGCSDLQEINQTVVRNRTYDYARHELSTPKQLTIPQGVNLNVQPVNPQVPYAIVYPAVGWINLGPPTLKQDVWVLTPSKEDALYKANLEKHLAILEAQVKDLKKASSTS